jgi:outer membrane autotransporter protein
VAAPVQVAYITSDGTATAGTDYQFGSGTLLFAPNEVQRTITVIVIGDTLFEPDETLTLTVTPAGGVPATATGTIVNDVSPPLARVIVISGNGQGGRLGIPLPQPLVVEVQDTRNAPVAGVAVQWRVTKGSAQLGSSTTTTNAQGRASNTVTLTSVGPVEVEASVAQLPPVIFTLASQTLFEQRATGPVAVPIARTLDQICARNDAVFNGACRALSILDDAQLTPALERVAPQQSGAESKVASAAISFVTSGIGARLAALRSGVERFSIQKLSLSISGTPIPFGALATTLMQQEPAADAQPDYNGWSGFLSGNIGSGERIARNGQLGFDLKTSGLMAGIDRQFGDAVFGVSVNVMQLDSTLSDAAGKLDTTGYAVSLYGSRSGLFAPTGTGRRYDGVHVDGSLTVGRNRYDAEHVVDIPTLPRSVARSENDASVFALTAGTGVEAHQGRTDYDLSLSGTWSRADIDDLAESGDGPLILFVQGHEIESAVATAGFNVRTAIPTSFGNVLPMFRAEMIHELKSGARLVTARFLRDTLNTAFTIPLDQPDPNYAKLSAGLQAVFPHGVAAFIEVTQDVLRSDLHFRTIQLNVSKSF